jgi:UDP-N-acetylmuramate--alanine ligase
VIGGRLKSADSNARLGAGRYLVAEADESDASFTHLQPMIAVVTNIDNDHLVTHEGDFGRLKQSFVDFLHNLPFYGLAILCLDDDNVRSILPLVARPVLTYGLAEGADLRAVNLRRSGLQTHFDIVRSGVAARTAPLEAPLSVTVNLPGTHNVLNSLAAIAVATELAVDDAAIQRALSGFQGIDRRLQHIADAATPAGPVSIVDDYGHHPTEIVATLEAVRQGYPNRRLVLAFQPHRYTRTRDLMEEFGTAFSEVDSLFVLDIYAASEKPMEGISGEALARTIREKGGRKAEYAGSFAAAVSAAAAVAEDGDMILTLGAGSVSQLGAMILEKLKERVG